MRVRRQVSPEVSMGKTTLPMTLIDFIDRETDEETEFVVGPNRGTLDPWLTDPACDIGKLVSRMETMCNFISQH